MFFSLYTKCSDKPFMLQDTTSDSQLKTWESNYRGLGQEPAPPVSPEVGAGPGHPVSWRPGNKSVIHMSPGLAEGLEYPRSRSLRETAGYPAFPGVGLVSGHPVPLGPVYPVSKEVGMGPRNPASLGISMGPINPASLGIGPGPGHPMPQDLEGGGQQLEYGSSLNTKAGRILQGPQHLWTGSIQRKEDCGYSLLSWEESENPNFSECLKDHSNGRNSIEPFSEREDTSASRERNELKRVAAGKVGRRRETNRLSGLNRGWKESFPVRSRGQNEETPQIRGGVEFNLNPHTPSGCGKEDVTTRKDFHSFLKCFSIIGFFTFN